MRRGRGGKRGVSFSSIKTRTPPSLVVSTRYLSLASWRHTRDMKRAAAAAAALALPYSLLSGGQAVVAWTAPLSLGSTPATSTWCLRCRQSRPAEARAPSRSSRISARWGGLGSASCSRGDSGGWVPRKRQEGLAWVRHTPTRLCMTAAAGGGIESENIGVCVYCLC